jgi:RNA polymerase sigma-70 factor (ECF subfamily)
VRRARAGDEEAFALLVERHERMVLRTALRLLGRLDLAEDAAQEAFLRLHRHLARFDESRELGPWLYRVVVNVCRSDLTRRARSPRVLGLDEAPELKSTNNNATALDDALVRDEQLRLVQAALLTLSLKEREAIVLRDIEGLTTSEVAQILGSSEGTVRSQISNGRLKIKRYIKSHGRARR